MARQDLREGWRWAIGSLTMLPSGPIRPSAAAARVLVAVAPVAVLPLALGAAALVRGGGLLGLPGLAIGLLAVGWLALGSRAMHLDGVADVVDGLGGGWEPSRARGILKRGDVGPMGVIALTILIGLQAVCIAALAERPGGWLLVGVSVAASRWLLAAACRAGLPAMPGSRLGADLVGAVPRWQMTLWLVLVPTVLALASHGAGGLWVQGAVAGLTAIALAAWLVRRCVRVFGGVNGDVLGAVIEGGLTVVLVVLACR